jgi:hypothetical protein
MNYKVACVLKHSKTARFHPAIFDGQPMQNGAIDEIGDVQLTSIKHHEQGFDTLDDAIMMIRSLDFDPKNICEIPLEWDGEPGLMWLLPNWKATGSSITKAISETE